MNTPGASIIGETFHDTLVRPPSKLLDSIGATTITATVRSHSLSGQTAAVLSAAQSRYAMFLFIVIPALGIPVVLLTRIAAWVFRPELFVGTLPSISKTAAFAPGTWIFTSGMSVVALCVVLAWPIGHMLNQRDLARFRGQMRSRGGLEWMNLAGTLLGICAGLALGALAIITLEIHDPVHVALSKIFFATKVVAIGLNATVGWRIGRYAIGAALPLAEVEWRGRLWMSMIIATLAVCFLVLFVTKDYALGTPEMVVRWMYVGTENLLCFLLLSYSLTYLPTVRRWRSPRERHG
jgi:hypothetical protein